jgi:hypothetical protein
MKNINYYLFDHMVYDICKYNYSNTMYVFSKSKVAYYRNTITIINIQFMDKFQFINSWSSLYNRLTKIYKK